MPNEYDEMMGTLRNLRSFRWRNIVALFKALLFMFGFSCMTEWKTFRVYGTKLGLAASVQSFGEFAIYGLVMVSCVFVVWLLLLKALTLDSHKLGFRLGSLFGDHADTNQPS